MIMVHNYFKILLRLFWRYWGYTLVKIGGLTIGITTFILILLFVNRERSYDQWNPVLDLKSWPAGLGRVPPS